MKHTIEEYQDSLNEIRFYAIDTMVNAEFEQRELYSDSDLLQELIDNQTPKKPTKIMRDDFDGYAFGNCECGTYVNAFNHDYCNRCGKKLDWSEDEKV
jgi:hypothetical protein